MDATTESGNTPLNIHSAGNEFATLLGEKPKEEVIEVSPEAAAEKLLADEAQSTAEQAAEAPEAGATKITVEVDGKTVELTSEQVADAYKNGMMQKDYQQKTAALSEQRKAAEAETAAAKTERADYATKLNNYVIQLQGVLTEQSKVNWTQLLETDPVEYLKQQHLFQERQAAYQDAQREQNKIWQQQQAEQVEQQNSFIAKQQEELLAKLPEWKDEAKAKADKEAMRAYLIDKQGFTPEIISGIQDHRAVLMIRKAMQYDALMERATAAKTKVQPLPPKAERPGNGVPQTDGRTAGMQRLAKTGKIEDAAKIFASML